MAKSYQALTKTNKAEDKAYEIYINMDRIRSLAL